MTASGSGLLCPQCGGKDTAVCDSRSGEGFIRRRRKCLTCKEWNRFSTLEMVVDSPKHHFMHDPVTEAMRLRERLDALPKTKRKLVLELLAAFGAG